MAAVTDFLAKSPQNVTLLPKRTARNRLVVVEYAASHSLNSRKIYHFMVGLSSNCSNVDFLLVMGDESDQPDHLVGDILYDGDNHSAVVQLHSGEDVLKSIEEHKINSKLLVLDVGLKHCGPCVKVYPTVIKLSRSARYRDFCADEWG